MAFGDFDRADESNQGWNDFGISGNRGFMDSIKDTIGALDEFGRTGSWGGRLGNTNNYGPTHEGGGGSDFGGGEVGGLTDANGNREFVNIGGVMLRNPNFDRNAKPDDGTENNPPPSSIQPPGPVDLSNSGGNNMGTGGSIMPNNFGFLNQLRGALSQGGGFNPNRPMPSGFRGEMNVNDPNGHYTRPMPRGFGERMPSGFGGQLPNGFLQQLMSMMRGGMRYG